MGIPSSSLSSCLDDLEEEVRGFFETGGADREDVALLLAMMVWIEVGGGDDVGDSSIIL